MLETSEQKRFCQLRRAVIEQNFARLNPQQRLGVMSTEGPLLLLAGAGSGKTTVLIHRVANLIQYGRGSDSGEVPDRVTAEDLAFLESYARAPGESGKARAEELCRLDPAPPWSILAITFTNKAAGELKERLANLLGRSADDVWASTFHSCCARILRRDIDKLGYKTSFTIYDAADSERVVKDILRDLGMDEKVTTPKTILGCISRAKDEGKLAETYAREQESAGDYRLQRVAKVYLEYERRLRAADALDFDDLILQTVLLLQRNQDALNFYQKKFRYVLVDEYQDTNSLQCRLAALLAGGHGNLCVVGDDDQSIYRFRGAAVENILSFESQHPGCRTIRLEQNYRSTRNILAAANAVIRNNQGRKGKELWTERGGGEKVRLHTAMNQSDEAQFVAAEMLAGYGQGRRWKDFAVLYRTNAQSRELELAMKRNGIPYKIVGGTRFFDRAEVKDMLAYLCVLHNPGDDLRLQRVINNPPRGIGSTTVERAQAIAVRTGQSLWGVVAHPEDHPELQKAAGKLRAFAEMMEELRKRAGEMDLADFYDLVCADTGYAAALEHSGRVEDRTRLENVRELRSAVSGYLENALEPSLGGFLDEIALYTDLDAHDPGAECAVLMTMHAAKGLEFPVVFVAGVEEGLFPGLRAIGDAEEMEEERRLCYVAMTRAKELLYMTCARERMLYGRTSANRPSRFLGEIPEERAERSGAAETAEPWRAEGTPRRERFYGGGPFDGGDMGRGGFGGYSAPRREGAFQGGGSFPRSGGGEGRNFAVSSPRKRPVQRPAAPAAPPPDFRQGETVRHKAFGRGVILALTPMGNDALMEVAFDDAGTKRLMLRAAAPYLEKIG